MDYKVHGVAKSQTRLSDLHFHTFTFTFYFIVEGRVTENCHVIYA